mmetsp:Transcript_65367/g.181790  ORF Transcript_65367/g.181790 Transcript_65367/m.181790 type:complete len:455 (+) Transcript_65367:57-1421(+)
MGGRVPLAPMFAMIFLLEAEPLSIRKWGCHRTETALIFVHIGKSGGGSVRARLAAAALDYNRSNWFAGGQDDHYYPLPNGERAKFCNSLHPNHRLPDTRLKWKTYEGTVPCNATTPLGMALACRETFRRHCRGCAAHQTHCHTVYVGHNGLGNELHWLPIPYLQRWWQSDYGGRELIRSGAGVDNPAAHSSIDILDQGFGAFLPAIKSLCGNPVQPRPRRGTNIWHWYLPCGAPLAERMDAEFRRLFQSQDYSPFYASLPVHRVVVLRDPWSWIVSKFFWNSLHRKNITCDDVRRETSNAGSEKSSPPLPFTGWAESFLLSGYLFPLCGVDCVQRFERGRLTLAEAESQAASNIQQSFSVVGLLGEIDSFYHMVTTRIAYVNMTLHPEVRGARHSTKVAPNSAFCVQKFQEPAFQEKFREASPIMAAVERLYRLGVRVNRFQKEELQACSTTDA